jgi:quercetin dioxygenase-like cupin family protein
MKKLILMSAALLCLTGVQAQANDVMKKEEHMILSQQKDRNPVEGPDEYFTGKVQIDPFHLEAQEPSRVTSAKVTFEPGARTNWHTHPLGQLLIVTSGKGWTQCEGEERVEVNEGDTIWCPPGHKHWHGATATTGMSHIAVQEMLDGKNVVWMEPVTDEQYNGGTE